MRLTVVILIGLLTFFCCAQAENSERSAADTRLLFFGQDDRQPINNDAEHPWNAIGQLETASGNLCSATLISPHLALTAGHCLLVPPGTPDNIIALRFVAQNNGKWLYEIHNVTGRVNPELGKKLKPEKNGWVIPTSAAPYDFGLLVLPTPLVDIAPLPLFSGNRDQLTARLKAAGRQVTQAGYPEDHLDRLYRHKNCLITGWAQKNVLSHQCDTLPGDSGSPLLLNIDNQWQIVAVQSSAPAAKDRYLADNRAIAVTAFLQQLAKLAQ